MRLLEPEIKNHFKKYKEVMILLGPRQVGKTTLLKKLFPEANYFLVDNEPVLRLLESYDANAYQSLIKENVPIIIDEAHLLSNPGRMAKIFYDSFPGIQLILTGSSSFHLKKGTQESLAGRKIDYHLFPLTLDEYLFQKGMEPSLGTKILDNLEREDFKTKLKLYDFQAIVKNILLFGLYPNVINHPQDYEYMQNFVDSIIFKDILGTGLIENQRVAKDLLKLLAHQIGNQVHYAELATKLGADQRTIKRYIEIFEESFLVYRVYPYLTNKRDEVSKTPKIYFLDVGIRNAILDNVTDITYRSDFGALFENFIFSEILKANEYKRTNFHLHYFRTRQGSEVDMVLSKEGKLIAVEIKWSKAKKNQAFLNRYPEASFKSLTMDTFF